MTLHLIRGTATATNEHRYGSYSKSSFIDAFVDPVTTMILLRPFGSFVPKDIKLFGFLND
jgi:hypothetical protein